MRIFETTSQAYLGIMSEVLYNPEYISSPRGMKCLEILDMQYRVLQPDSKPIVTCDEERNLVIADYTVKELEWYLSGNMNADSAPSAFWKKLANPDGTINSNYGYLVLHDNSEGCRYESDYPFEVYRTPYEWALETLKKDKDSRQAIIRYNKPEHAWMGTKDFCCTLNAVIHIRENKLHMSVDQRSGDANFGLVYDIPWHCWLQDKIITDLKSTYPELQKGSFTHLVHSFHIYERDIERIKKMLGH
jgi:thymidylate synthase